MKNRLQYLLIVLGCLVISCKTTKQPAQVALQSMTKTERINSILQSEVQYNTLSANLKLTIKTGKKNKEMSVDAQLRIVKDEALQLSLRIPILGTEAFKLLITPDNLLIIDRLNKQYLSESMQDIQAKAPFDFDYYCLEALLTNQLFIAGKKEITAADYEAFRIREDDFFVHLLYTDKQNIQYDFTGDYSNRIQTTQMIQEKWNAQYQCTYTDWGLTSDKRAFPMSVNTMLNTVDDTYRLNFFYKFVEINPEFMIDSAIPGKYKQITLQQVIRLIENML